MPIAQQKILEVFAQCHGKVEMVLENSPNHVCEGRGGEGERERGGEGRERGRRGDGEGIERGGRGEGEGRGERD